MRFIVSFSLPRWKNNINVFEYHCLYKVHQFISTSISYYRLIDGFEVLDELEKLPVNPKTYKPLSDIRINRVTIHANPLAG